jgi:hypothetical protein
VSFVEACAADGKFEAVQTALVDLTAAVFIARQCAATGGGEDEKEKQEGVAGIHASNVTPSRSESTAVFIWPGPLC